MKISKAFFEDKNIITELEDGNWKGNMESYKIGGVWALYGEKNESSDEWICLQVGQTINIAVEIEADIERMKQKINDPRKKSYVNQFGKELFCYDEYFSVQEILYTKIITEYKQLKFLCVYETSNSEIRKNIEKYFAWNTYPLYWRNGGPYRKDKEYSESKLKEMKDNVISGIKLENDILKKINLFFEQ